MYTHRLCAWRARSSAAARPPSFNRRCAALCSRRGFIVASWIHCCKNVTARCAGSRFALRAQVVRRCAAPLLALLRSLSLLAASRLASLHRAALLRCSPCPLRGRSLVRRCCGALSPLREARSAVRRCCAARPRCAGRRPVSPLLRLAVGLRALRQRPYSRLSIRARSPRQYSTVHICIYIT
jgi:hypothetical protein